VGRHPRYDDGFDHSEPIEDTMMNDLLLDRPVRSTGIASFDGNGENVSNSIRWTAADLPCELGNIPADRIRMVPPPGTATEADAITAHNSGIHCELIDGTLVEKAMGNRQAFMAVILGSYLWPFVRSQRLGIVTAPDAMFKMISGNIREPDLSFTHRSRLPNPFPAIGGWCPDLCVEILSDSNTVAEMTRKRHEYFASGCRMVWEVDPRSNTIDVYTSVSDVVHLGESATLSGGAVLPGFTLKLSQLFGEYRDALPNQVTNNFEVA
jgi:Uma2 family endonuclease